jgi:excisionase family DNA binding protein
MNEADAMTTAEAAERLGCSVKTIARMVDDGRLTALMKLPGLRGPYLFAPSVIEHAAKGRAAELAAELERLNAAAS